MLRTEQDFELNVRGPLQEVDGWVTLAVVAGVIGDEAHAQPLQRGKFLSGKHINSVENFRLLTSAATGFGFGPRRQRTGNIGEVETHHRFRRKIGKRAFERQHAPPAVGMHAVGEKNPERFGKRVDPERCPGEPRVAE